MDNFGGIFTTLSQTCKKFHCLKNGQRVDSWENDCLRQKDAEDVYSILPSSEGVVLELHALKKFFGAF